MIQGGDMGTMMIDGLGRRITYLRVSVTDRCDLRCTYCMSPDPEFLPRGDLLTLEEVERICRVFVTLGVSKIRVTGGEPLLRKDVMALFRALGAVMRAGDLKEVCLTTNGTTLDRYAEDLVRCGVRRVKVSLDTLDPVRFQDITGRNALPQVLDGLEAARRAGLRVKINAVVLPTAEAECFDALLRWCGTNTFDLTLIEAMPMGGLADGIPAGEPLRRVKEFLSRRWSLLPLAEQTGGPARYVRVAETGGLLGFITPMSHGFCDNCNRVRLTCQGELKLCLGRGDSVDLRALVRSGSDDFRLKSAILAAIKAKPSGHDFIEPDGISSNRIRGGMNRVGG